MITTKQRAYLRGLANKENAIFQIGKGGICDNLIKQIDDALTARELIKMRVLETCPESSRTAADTIAQRVGADVVQVIGKKIVLYKPDKDNPQIKLPQ